MWHGDGKRSLFVRTGTSAALDSPFHGELVGVCLQDSPAAVDTVVDVFAGLPRCSRVTGVVFVGTATRCSRATGVVFVCKTTWCSRATGVVFVLDYLIQ